MGGRSKGRKSKYTPAVIKLKYQVICNKCDRMRRRFMQVGMVKDVPIIICVECVEKMRKEK